MRAAGPEQRHLVAELDLLRRRLGGKAAIAAEGERADTRAAVREERRHAHPPLGQHDERVLRVVGLRGVHAHLVDDPVVELRAEGHHRPAAERPQIAAVVGHREGANPVGILALPVPVAPQRQCVMIADDEILARERREDVGVASGRYERRGGRHAKPSEVAQEPARRVRTYAVALQDLVIGVQQRLESVAAHAPLRGGEPKGLVLSERAAEPEAQLVLCITLAERRRRRVRELEIGFVRHVAERSLQLVCAAARGAGDLPAGELPARDVVGVGDNAGVAYGLRRYRTGAEGEAVERDLVLVGPLAGDGEGGRR